MPHEAPQLKMETKSSGPGIAYRAASSLKSSTVAAGLAVGSSIIAVAPQMVGAIDVMMVRQPDGSIKSSPFYVRFGKYTGLRTADKKVQITVNGVDTDFHMHLGRTGEAYFVAADGDEGFQEDGMAGIMSPASGYSSSDEPTPFATSQQASSLQVAMEEVKRQRQVASEPNLAQPTKATSPRKGPARSQSKIAPATEAMDTTYSAPAALPTPAPLGLQSVPSHSLPSSPLAGHIMHARSQSTPASPTIQDYDDLLADLVAGASTGGAPNPAGVAGLRLDGKDGTDLEKARQEAEKAGLHLEGDDDTLKARVKQEAEGMGLPVSHGTHVDTSEQRAGEDSHAVSPEQKGRRSHDARLGQLDPVALAGQSQLFQTADACSYARLPGRGQLSGLTTSLAGRPAAQQDGQHAQQAQHVQDHSDDHPKRPEPASNAANLDSEHRQADSTCKSPPSQAETDSLSPRSTLEAAAAAATAADSSSSHPDMPDSAKEHPISRASVPPMPSGRSSSPPHQNGNEQATARTTGRSEHAQQAQQATANSSGSSSAVDIPKPSRGFWSSLIGSGGSSAAANADANAQTSPPEPRRFSPDFRQSSCEQWADADDLKRPSSEPSSPAAPIVTARGSSSRPPAHPWSVGRPRLLPTPSAAQPMPVVIEASKAAAPVDTPHAVPSGAEQQNSAIPAVPADPHRADSQGGERVGNRMELEAIDQGVREHETAQFAMFKAQKEMEEWTQGGEKPDVKREFRNIAEVNDMNAAAAGDGRDPSLDPTTSYREGAARALHISTRSPAQCHSSPTPSRATSDGSGASTRVQPATSPFSAEAYQAADAKPLSRSPSPEGPDADLDPGRDQVSASPPGQPGSVVEHAVLRAQQAQQWQAAGSASPSQQHTSVQCELFGPAPRGRLHAADPKLPWPASPGRDACTPTTTGHHWRPPPPPASTVSYERHLAGPARHAADQSAQRGHAQDGSGRAGHSMQSVPELGSRTSAETDGMTMGASPPDAGGYLGDSEALGLQGSLGPRGGSMSSVASDSFSLGRFGSSSNQGPSMLGRSLKSWAALDSFELSLCASLLRPDLSPQEALDTFEAHKVGEQRYAEAANDIIASPELVCRIGRRLFPFREALPMVLGVLAFGGQWDTVLTGTAGLPMAVAELPPEVGEQQKQSAQQQRGKSLNDKERRSSWRVWLGSWRSSSRKDDALAIAGGSGELLPNNGKRDESRTSVQSAPPGTLSPGADLALERMLSQRLHKPARRRAFVPTPQQLASLPLHEGQNTIDFTFGKQRQRAYVYFLKWNSRLVISDIDGTITKSDILGHFLPRVGVDWSHIGVNRLFTNIRANGYDIMYLSSRAIAQASATRDYLHSLKQNGESLPSGPVIISPDGLFPSLYRELVLRRPHEFKIRCLEDIRALFPPDWNPFYAGFGNRDTDEISYFTVGVPPSKIFIINPRGELRKASSTVATSTWASLTGINSLVDEMFPALLLEPSADTQQREEYSDYNFWHVQPAMIIDDPEPAARDAGQASDHDFESADEDDDSYDEDEDMPHRNGLTLSPFSSFPL